MPSSTSHTTAVESIHAALTSADAQLTHLSAKLQAEISSNIPAGVPNPAAVHLRIRELQSRLQNLRESLLSTHHQKLQLVALCRAHATEAADFANAIQPKQTPEHDALEKSSKKVANVLVTFDDSHMRAMATPTNHRKFDLNLALLKANTANVPTFTEETYDTMEESTDHTEKEDASVKERTSGEIKKVKSKKGKEKKQGNEKENGSGNSIKKHGEEDKVFEPVPKAVFNRLPRNIKIKAGKLTDVNLLYERVFKVLSEAGKPLSEKDMVKKCGEDDTAKLDVLRGLAVVRYTKQGWQLA